MATKGLGMPYVRLLAALSFVVLSSISPSAGQTSTLRVALYPYVPDKYAIFTLLAREFQHKHPSVVVDLVEIDGTSEYYEGGLHATEADVYEIDSILLSEMLDKIAPLQLSLDEFPPEAVEAVTRKGAVFAIPHWLCGNFLFYRKDNTAIRDAVTWSDLVEALARQNKGALFDLFGRLTIGEWYLTMLADRIGAAEAQARIMNDDGPDPTVVGDLRSILAACPTGFCRSKYLHDRTGSYARAFTRGEAAAYIGYSETMHYGLQEIIDNCGPGTSCLSPDEIAVRRLPTLSAAATKEGIGWVDGLAISSQLGSEKKLLAMQFIQFATSAEAYKLVLEPGWLEAPRYLLPARKGLTIKDAPLYPALLAAHSGRKTATAVGLNDQLQKISQRLNCALPIDRTDNKTADSCPRR